MAVLSRGTAHHNSTVHRVSTTDPYPSRGTAPTARFPRAHPTVWPGQPDGPMSSAQLSEHDRSGFHQFSLLEPGEVDRYRRELDRLASDPHVSADERTVTEQASGEVRSIFDVHRLSDSFAALVVDERVAGRARQILGSDVYVHQSRINYMPGFRGAGFYWHSDFETWHTEDGMPVPRAVSIQIALTDNYPFNGGLMVLPGSHRTFVPCPGETPDGNYKQSLRAQQFGVPDEGTIREMTHEHGIEQFTGPAGQALAFDANLLHGSGNNITPLPRSNIFVVFNSVHNALTEPYAGTAPRPGFIADRDTTPVAGA